jgi:hypothetical protein
MKIETTDPLDHTPFPNRSVLQSFMELSRNFLEKRADSNILPCNRMVKITYDDGEITTNEICLAIVHSCREFGNVAIVEQEINFIGNRYNDVVSLTYNRIFSKNLKLELENPIKSIIVKDYEVNKQIHGENMEEEIKISFHALNFKTVYSGSSIVEQRNSYPCFFLVN